MSRIDGRKNDELRPVEIIPNINKFAEGSCLIRCGNTHVLCTASVEDRARRRWEELQERGTPKDFDELLEEIRQRDHNDASRSAAPLRPAEDAIRLDTTGNTFEQSRQQILEIIKERLGQ